MLKKFKLLFLVVFVCSLTVAASAQAVRFKVKIDPSLAEAGKPLSGRLLVFMTNNMKPTDGFGVDFQNPEAVYVTGTEVGNFDANRAIEINPDALAFPRKFSEAPAGDYQLFALLDANHSYTYDGPGAGDLYSAVVKISLPAAGETELTLFKRVPERKFNPIKNLQVVEFESPLLSAFWGKPVKMQASVLLPPSYDKDAKQKYPTVYNVHGYGGGHLKVSGAAAKVYKEMEEGKRPEVINVYLNGHFSLGHHVFADSVNNGPWGTALVKEFIPFLEKQFRMDAKPNGRFLTGHSSGGWATLWVMINNPDFFGGVWSTAPDPVDFRAFTGPDLYAAQNVFADASGKEYNLMRLKGREVMSLRQYAQQEKVLGAFGGQMASFNAVFSPRGADGQPMPLFDAETGAIDPFVLESWKKYDISRLLRENWKTLAPKLKGKIHIAVGTADTFRLDESLRLLDGELKKLGSDAKIEYLEGKDHFNLYEGGLANRFADEMYAVARPKAKTAATAAKK
jgi:S-formylglutathione hydrolase FrmB